MKTLIAIIAVFMIVASPVQSGTLTEEWEADMSFFKRLGTMQGIKTKSQCTKSQTYCSETIVAKLNNGDIIMLEYSVDTIALTDRRLVCVYLKEHEHKIRCCGFYKEACVSERVSGGIWERTQE